MKKNSILALIIFPLIFSYCQKYDKVEREGEPDVYNVDQDDLGMNNAIKEAQSSIRYFIKCLNSPNKNQTSFSLKGKFIEKDQVEHIWLNSIKYDGTFFYGIIFNEPVYIKNLKNG